MAGSDKGTGGGRRRGAVKPRTIDLEAEDVTPEPETTDEAKASETEGAADDRAPSVPESPQDGDQTSIEEAARTPVAGEPPVAEEAAESAAFDAETGAEAPPREPPVEEEIGAARNAEPAAPPRRNAGTSMAGAALAGALAALAVVALLYFFGAFAAGPGDDTAALQGIEQRVTALESAEPDTGAADAVAGLEQRLSGLEERLAALPAEAPDLSGIESRLSELEAAESAPAEAPDLSQFETRMAELQSRVAALAERSDEELMGRLDAMGVRVETLARAAAASVALSALSRRVDAGRPYSERLDSLRALVEGGADLGALSAHAEAGLATAGELAAGFDAAAGVMLDQGAEAAPSESIVSRLASSARSLVRIRPAEPVEGDSRGAVLSRIEAALGAGDLQAAYAEWQTLDEAARTAAADWGARLEARVDAEAEIAALAEAAAGRIADASAPAETQPSGEAGQ